MFFSWHRSLRRGLGLIKSVSARGRSARGEHFSRLQLECLEDRTVPSITLKTTTQTVIAASYFDSAVYAFDANTGVVLQTLVAPNSNSSVLSSPAGLAIGSDGNLYISSQGNDSIVEYNFSTQKLATFIPSSVLKPIATAANGAGSVFAPAGLAFGPDGNLYVSLNGGHAATSGGEVIRFNININSPGNQLAYAGAFNTIATGLIQPTELAFGINFGDTHNLYVSDSGADTVVRIAGADGTLPSTSTFINTGSGGLNYPSGLTWGTDGNLYVTDLGATSGQGQVLVYSPSSPTASFLKVFTHPASSLSGQFPSSALFLSNGALLTANLGLNYPTSLGGPGPSGSISEFNPDGSFNQVLTSSAFPANPTTGVTNISPTQIVLETAPPNLSNFVLAQDTVNRPYSQTITAGGGTGAVQLSVSNIQNAIPGLTLPNSGTGSLAIGGTPTAIGTEKFTVTATDGVSTTTINYSITVNPAVSLKSTTQTVIAASYFENAVYAFDATSGALLQTLVAPNSSPLLISPAGLAIGPDGNLYMSSQSTDSIVEYNFSTQKLSTFIGSSVLTPIATAANGSKAVFAPAGLVFGPDSNLYVELNGGQSARSGGEVIRFSITSQNGQLAYGGSFTAVATGLIQPTELTFGVNAGDTHNLYTSNSVADTVVKITGADGASPSSSTFISAGSGGLNYPSGLAWGPDGNLYVTDLGATTGIGQVLVYNPSGSYLKVFTHPQSVLLDAFPSDGLFLANGDLLTANLGQSFPVAFGGPGSSGSITEFNPDGSFNQVLTSAAFPASNTPAAVTNISPTQLVLATSLPNLSNVVLQPDTVNHLYNQTISAASGTGTSQLVVSNIQNAIPGLTLPSSGVGSLTISGTPTMIGTETFTVTATDALGSVSTINYSITVNPSVTVKSTTQTVIAAAYYENAVYALDAGTGALLQTLVAPNSGSALATPAGLAIGPDGNLYLSSQANDSIDVYNFSTQKLSVFLPSTVLTPIAAAVSGSKAVFAPAGLAFGPDGNLYVDLNGGQRATSGGEVIRFNITNQNGQLAYGGTFATVASGLIQPTELAFGVNPGDTHNLYTSNSFAGNVVKITGADGASPTTSTFIPAGSGGLNYPSGLVWGSDGNLYVTDLGATNGLGQELVYSPSGSFLKVFAHPASALTGQFPSDAVFLANGNLLTANLGPSGPPNTAGSITEFNADGSLNQVLTSSAFPPSATGITHISPTQLTLLTSPANFSSIVLEPGEVSRAYGQTITAGSGTGTIQLSVSNIQNAIPGLTIPTSGAGTLTIGGIPTATGTETFSVTAIDGVGGTTTINYSITVLPVLTTATHFAVTAPASVTAGNQMQVTVTALTELNDTAVGYTGTVHFASTDTQALLPANTTLVNGVGVFSATLITAGTQTLTATDTLSSSITGGTTNITVSPAAASRFTLSAPGTANTGTAFTYTVIAQDQFYNTATSYGGTVRFASSDVSASLPINATLNSGIGIFSATLNTAGNQTITAYDTGSNLITGRTNAIAVTGTATKFVVSAPGSAAAGSVFVFTVTAEDSKSNIAASYSGTVHITTTDSQAILPADATLTNGIGFFPVVLRTGGSQTLTATDTVTTTIKGTSGKITVSAAAANHFAVLAPASAITGAPFNFTVTALDPFNNVAVGYQGTVTFTSSDGAVSPGSGLPSNYTFTASGTGADNGVHVFSAILMTPGSQTISAADTLTSAIVGTSNAIASRGLIVTSFNPTPTGFVATFSKPFNPSQISLYDTSGTFGPDDVLLTEPGTSPTSFHGSLIIDPTDTTITFVKTSTFTNSVNSFNPQTGVLPAGTYTVTFRSAANGFVDLAGSLLDGTASGNAAGGNYTTTFVVASTPTEVFGIPGFARGPNSAQTITLPNSLPSGAGQGGGIPLNLSTGSGVTSGKFTLQYNSALLSITGVTVNSALTGATLTYDAASTPGSAVIDFSSPTALTAGPVRLGGLVATVPNSAASQYTAKALLHWSSVSINGGTTAAVGDDAVDVDAYFGDVNGDGTLSGGDASLISRVATGVDNNPAAGVIAGFSAFRLADPALIGDLTATGNVGAGDVTLMNSYLSGTPRPQIPTIPVGLTIPANGVDPALSIPTDLQATPGGTVVVPVQIDSARPEGSTGVSEAILAVQFNPAEFTVSAQDVQLGSLLLTSAQLPASGERGGLEGSGWQLQTAINSQTGQIGIDLFSTMPLQTNAGGTLVTISFHVRENAAGGSTGINLVPSVNPTGSRPFLTTVSDSQGAMVLHAVETTLGTMPGTPGTVTVTSRQWALNNEQWAVDSKQVAVNNDQLAESNQEESVLALASGHSPLANASVLEQVFGELAPMMASQDNTLGQPAVNLNSAAEAQATAAVFDQSLLQQVGATQHDWVPSDLTDYLGQTLIAGRRSPLGGLVNSGIEEQDATEVEGIREFR